MLNRDTLPVWILADTLLAVAAVGGLSTLLILTPPPSAPPPVARRLETELEQLREQARVQEARRARFEAENQHLQAELAWHALRVTDLERYEREAVAWIKNAQQLLAAAEDERDRERMYHQRLLNLRGDLTRTIFLIDISGSMGQSGNLSASRPNWGTDGQPWTYVQNQVDSWLSHLPVESFRVICFNDRSVDFPLDKTWAAGDDDRKLAREFLTRTRPKGLTFTENALRRALAYQPTTIMLFTDGAPSDAKGGLDIRQQERIIALLEQSGGTIPINVIAVNNYLEPGVGNFLHRIAAVSGGGFLGL